MPLRMAVFRIGFTVVNNSTEQVDVDLTGPGGIVATRAVFGGISDPFRTEQFNATGRTFMTISLIDADLRNPYANVTATPGVRWSVISPGKVRVQLVARGDIGSGNAPFGSASYSVTVYQLP